MAFTYQVPTNLPTKFGSWQVVGGRNVRMQKALRPCERSAFREYLQEDQPP